MRRIAREPSFELDSDSFTSEKLEVELVTIGHKNAPGLDSLMAWVL